MPVMNKLPFTVIGGYLGAGKTTLLNHMLRNSDGRRLALLINDFGRINIDAELIESQDDSAINLANGCICCSLAGGFVGALNGVQERRPRPDHVIIEASGVSDPAKIARYGQTPGFSLDGVIVLADAETVRARADDKYVGRTVLRQLKSADLVVLNKVDLVTAEQKQAVVNWLAQIAPESRLLQTQYGAVPIALLLGLDTARKLPAETEAGGHDHYHDADFATWSYTSDRPLARSRFERVADGLPETVIRAKGVLYLEDAPEQRMIFQLVGRHWTLTPGDAWGVAKPETRLVFIGVREQFDPAVVAGPFDAFVVTQ
jgi:G3E family GTPase